MWSCLCSCVHFLLQLLCILCHYHLFPHSIRSICTCLEKTVPFCIFQENFLQFFCSLKYQASAFLFIITPFLYVFSRLFINLYIVIKSSLSHLSFIVISCISSNLSSYVRSFKSGTIFVAILCILFNFNTCFSLCGDHINFAYYSQSTFRKQYKTKE